jgi:GTPase involved in cell partitioning and DNA repair
VRSGPGEARTILLLHIISVRPSKQSLMVRTFLKVYIELGSYFLFLQEQIKDIIINRPASLDRTSFADTRRASV